MKILCHESCSMDIRRGPERLLLDFSGPQTKAIYRFADISSLSPLSLCSAHTDHSILNFICRPPVLRKQNAKIIQLSEFPVARQSDQVRNLSDIESTGPDGTLPKREQEKVS